MQKIEKSEQDYKILIDVSEYWDYLSSGKIWDHSKDGLLKFLLDILFQMDKKY